MKVTFWRITALMKSKRGDLLSAQGIRIPEIEWGLSVDI